MLKTGQIQNFTIIYKARKSLKTDSLIQYMAFKKATITGIKKNRTVSKLTYNYRQKQKETDNTIVIMS